MNDNQSNQHMRKDSTLQMAKNFNSKLKMSHDALNSRDIEYQNIRLQLKDRQLRYLQAKRMFNKIQKDLKNVERDNLELQEMLTSLL